MLARAREVDDVDPGLHRRRGVTAERVRASRPSSRAASCTIGFQNPLAANESLQWFQKAAIAQAKAYGCKIIVLDDALSPDKQVSNMQQLLAQGAQAIIFYPLDPKATLPVLAQAKSKGVPVIAIDATFGNPKLPVAPGIVTQVWQGRDIMAFLQVQAPQGGRPAREGRAGRDRRPGARAQVPEPA